MDGGASSLDCGRAFKALLCARIITSSIILVDFTLLFVLLSYQWHATALEVGVATACYGLPGLIIGPWFGVVADRSDPIHLLKRSYWGRAISSIGLVVSPTFFAFILFVICQGVSNLGVMPSEQILIKRTLTTEWMIRHARYANVFDQIAKVVAPLAGAALSHGIGARGGYIFSAALVLPATACLHAVGKIRAARRSGEGWQCGVSRNVGSLLSVVRQRAEYRWAYFATLLQTIVLGFYDPLLALFLRQVGQPVETFGIIVSATACGGVAAAFSMRKLPEVQGAAHTEWLLAGFGLSVFLPGLLVTFGVLLPMAALVLLWLINGYCYGSTAIRFAVTQQAQCPADCLGRVAATARSTQLAALVCGPLVGSTMASFTGIPVILVLAGGVAIASAFVFRWRRLLLNRCSQRVEEA
jgi:hypothetical protein